LEGREQLTRDLPHAVRAAAGCIGANAGTRSAIGIDGSGTSVMMMTAYGFHQS
jgi:hypothetical protein